MPAGGRKQQIVDTNVGVTANGRSGSGLSCQLRCQQALRSLMKDGLLVLDDGWRILKEYKANLSESGQPGVGDAFVRWALTNRANPKRCQLVPIRQKVGDREDYDEFPDHPALQGFDPADRKFVAVAMAHKAHPPILQATDSKWVGWAPALLECGVQVEFLCPEQIEARYLEKHSRQGSSELIE